MNIDMIPLISFVIVTTFTPGPNNISSASMGVMYGYKTAFNFLVGIAFGFFVVMIACAYLSSALLAVIPVAERYLRWIGAVYILWLAIGTLRSSYSFSESDGLSKAFTKGFILQLFNPKVAVYGLTLYSTFLAPISRRMDYLSLSALSFAFTAFVATSTWALFGAAIKEKLKNNSFKKIVNTSLSILLIYTAIELLGIWK
ncbi:MAG: LysE family translocator [Desulfobacteraceae bacterium]|nr:LysE family translocator [Desulfobacteraceae bacterium]MDH3573966.1 LysE family translocator [Desulfobacteraceae bacterium]MDH3721960.1 LysE family translocator [Desulfobacteraceae bacterium]MDH3875063.1 LysE family translocator [Desulfobacteraceae bacterium]